jgi:hypothetical protein
LSESGEEKGTEKIGGKIHSERDVEEKREGAKGERKIDRNKMSSK